VRAIRAGADVPILATGGVTSVHDLRAYLDAGATLVGIGTAALADPRFPARLVRELEAA
jgi:dihydroorotate dehydrogenase (NAD+) catalytic subunit